MKSKNYDKKLEFLHHGYDSVSGHNYDLCVIIYQSIILSYVVEISLHKLQFLCLDLSINYHFLPFF